MSHRLTFAAARELDAKGVFTCLGAAEGLVSQIDSWRRGYLQSSLKQKESSSFLALYGGCWIRHFHLCLFSRVVKATQTEDFASFFSLGGEGVHRSITSDLAFFSWQLSELIDGVWSSCS